MTLQSFEFKMEIYSYINSVQLLGNTSQNVIKIEFPQILLKPAFRLYIRAKKTTKP